MNYQSIRRGKIEVMELTLLRNKQRFHKNSA